ncbi:MAG: hypothetical protein K8T10_02990 [Candidatus Eremiobacteraeota bacterium]|nr:hypothetical protein [Candidatus Eremiobacteraeota bacterium]
MKKNRLQTQIQYMRRQKGMLIIIALAILFILLILATALIFQGGTALQYSLRFRRMNLAERTIQITRVRFEETFQSKSPGERHKDKGKDKGIPLLPTSGKFVVYPEIGESGKKYNFEMSGTFEKGHSIYRPVPEEPGYKKSEGFQPDEIPLVGYQDACLEKGFRDTPVSPWHSLVVLSARNGKRYLTMYSGAFPYGIYAPRGKVFLDSARSFSNPTMAKMIKHAFDESLNYSGIPISIRAKKGIEIKDFPHGRAYNSEEGKISIQGGGIGFSGIKFKEDYSLEVSAQIENAIKELSDVTLDKTSYLIGTPLNLVSIFEGKFDFGQIFSLEQAREIPFPILPTWQNLGAIQNFMFHVPKPPDLAPDYSHDEETRKQLAKLKRLQKKWEGVDPGKLKEKKKAEYDKDMKQIQKIVDELKRKGKEGEPGQAPKTRKDEKSFSNIGYNYINMLKGVIDKIGILFSKGPKEFMRNLLDRVRVVHYRDGPPDIEFIHKGGDTTGFKWVSNWSVPRGRTVKLKQNVTILGDLWIQDGAVFHVVGNLTVKSPPGESKNPLAPCGRVHLGKGSVLIVDGNFQCEGKKFLGSVSVDSPLGKVNYITSAILCTGNVTIPHGTVPGIKFNTLAGELVGGELETFLDTVLDVAPHIAKVLGPFHRRKCYFASYADTITVIITPVGPIPFPSFLPKKNYTIPIFKIFTMAYTINLNMMLGENLFLDTDWWILGKGVVPILPKIPGITLVKDAFSETTFEGIGKEILNDIGDVVINCFLKEIGPQIIIYAVGTILSAVIQSVAGISIDLAGIFSKFAGSESGLKGLKNKIRLAANKTLKKICSDVYAILKEHMKKSVKIRYYETPGVLVYSGKKLKIGEKEKKGEFSKCILASGMFVSQQDMEIYANQTVGCLISVNGNITARDFYYYPYFTRASLTIPKKFDTAIENLVHFKNPKSEKKPLGIGLVKYHIIGEGWEK